MTSAVNHPEVTLPLPPHLNISSQYIEVDSRHCIGNYTMVKPKVRLQEIRRPRRPGSYWYMARNPGRHLTADEVVIGLDRYWPSLDHQIMRGKFIHKHKGRKPKK